MSGQLGTVGCTVGFYSWHTQKKIFQLSIVIEDVGEANEAVSLLDGVTGPGC